MRVEKLEINGFKSFGDKTILSLHPGITAIVGPNGCGKSNVVDSFKWVLGEQSAKSMRGGKMEEVIFVGSQNKKPKGMSEVAMTVRGLGPTPEGKDAPTVVTRRLYRSGESDYMINRQSCRLRDIRDMFLDTGLEIKSYSILEQDRISAILTAKPEDRRFIIEEIAGVVKYKIRRTEAQSKLESSRANILRINDIVNEVRRQINSLDRQVKKAERYNKLTAELRSIELRLSRYELKQLDNLLRDVTAALIEQRERDALMRGELSEAEGGVEVKRIELAERQRAMQDVASELQIVERSIGEARTTLAVHATERDNMKNHIIRLGAQDEENVARRLATLSRRDEIGLLREGLRAELSQKQQEYEERSSELQGIQQDVASDEQHVESMRRESFGASEAVNRLRSEHERYRSAIENLAGRERTVQTESAEIGKRQEDLDAERLDIEANIHARRGEMFAAHEERRIAASAIEEIRARLEGSRANTARSREELASTTSRLESLSEMIIDESGEAALRERVSVLSAIADAIEAPAEYEGAIEGALREIISGFLLESTDDIRTAVEGVREMGMGRTAFVARINARDAGPMEGALPEGVVARASDVLRGSEQYLPVVRGLLKNVLIVRDLDAALSIPASDMTLVTLQGEIREPSGAVIAGKSRGILTIKRQIRELQAEAERIRHTIERFTKETASAEAELAVKQEALKLAETKSVELDRELTVLRHKSDACKENIDRALRKLSQLRIEGEELIKEKEKLSAQLGSKGEEIARGDERRRGIEGAINEANEKLSMTRSMAARKREEATEVRVTLTSLKERATALDAEERNVGRLLVEMDEKHVMIGREVEATKQKIEEREGVIAAREAEHAGLAVKAADLNTRIDQAREVIAAMTAELSDVERGLRGVRVTLDEIMRRIGELEVQRAESTMKLEGLLQKMHEAYNVDLRDLTFEVPQEEDAPTAADLKQKIEALGPVSLGSLEEYEELRTRHEFLTQQQQDLNKSIAELEEAISRINTSTRRMLRDAYEAIKVKFAEVYVTLFGGGRAELVLTDPDNILETGIDIIAQPPGKRLQNISLLSGGEKTLTALALLFASFLIKPTPLCILDEADAALDEHNTLKFAEMLKELSKSIQFIVVTHNRVTMEAADYIYGVTMEEPGCSKAISMRMEQDEAPPVEEPQDDEEDSATVDETVGGDSESAPDDEPVNAGPEAPKLDEPEAPELDEPEAP